MKLQGYSTGLTRRAATTNLNTGLVDPTVALRLSEPETQAQSSEEPPAVHLQAFGSSC